MKFENLIGNSVRKIDYKGRIILPTDCECDENEEVILLKTEFGIRLYSLDHLDEIDERIYPMISIATIDKERRINLSSFPKYYEFDRNIILLYRNNCIDIISQNKFKDYAKFENRRANEREINVLSQKNFGSGSLIKKIDDRYRITLPQTIERKETYSLLCDSNYIRMYDMKFNDINHKENSFIQPLYVNNLGKINLSNYMDLYNLDRKAIILFKRNCLDIVSESNLESYSKEQGIKIISYNSDGLVYRLAKRKD